MTAKTWVNAHFRKGQVQIELNMQTSAKVDPYIFRLMYMRRQGAEKGVTARRKLRAHTSIGQTGWDQSPTGVAMVEFEHENKVVIQRMAKAWLAGDTDKWHELRKQVESALQVKAASIEVAA